MTVPGETVASGGGTHCEDCNTEAVFGVYQSAAGYYIGYWCQCSPWSRESGYYKTLEAAEAALKTGAYGRV